MVKKTELERAQEALRVLQSHDYNNRLFNVSPLNAPYSPYILSFSALNDEDMDRKIMEHIYNRLRRASGKKSISLPPSKPWWRFWG